MTAEAGRAFLPEIGDAQPASGDARPWRGAFWPGTRASQPWLAVSRPGVQVARPGLREPSPWAWVARSPAAAAGPGIGELVPAGTPTAVRFGIIAVRSRITQIPGRTAPEAGQDAQPAGEAIADPSPLARLRSGLVAAESQEIQVQGAPAHDRSKPADFPGAVRPLRTRPRTRRSDYMPPGGTPVAPPPRPLAPGHRPEPPLVDPHRDYRRSREMASPTYKQPQARPLIASSATRHRRIS